MPRQVAEGSVFVALAAFAVGCPDSRLRTAKDAGFDVDPRLADVSVDSPQDTSVDDEIHLDPGCDAGEDVLPPPIDAQECELFVEGSCLDDGLACYPIVEYPTGSCGEEVFATVCLPVGGGSQDAPCTSAADCAAGYTCFVTGAMDRCLQLCDLGGGAPACPRGLVCKGTDYEAMGACI